MDLISGFDVVSSSQEFAPPPMWRWGGWHNGEANFEIFCYVNFVGKTDKEYITAQNHIIVSDEPDSFGKARWYNFFMRREWRIEETKEGGLVCGHAGTQQFYFRQLHVSNFCENLDRVVQKLEVAQKNYSRVMIKGRAIEVEFDPHGDQNLARLGQFNGWDQGRQCPLILIDRIDPL